MFGGVNTGKGGSPGTVKLGALIIGRGGNSGLSTGGRGGKDGRGGTLGIEKFLQYNYYLMKNVYF